MKNALHDKNSLIRFGITCTTTTVGEWQARCLEHLLELENVELGLLIFDDGDANPTSAPKKLQRIRWNRVLFEVYRDHFLRPAARRPVDLSDSLSKVSSVRCKLIRKGKFSRYFSDSDARGVQSYNLDFILRFAPGIIRGGILGAARYGVWSYHHDDEEKYRGGPPCFWEIYHGDPRTGAILQRLTDRLDAGIILRKGYVPTVHDSYARNIDSAYFASAPWPAQVCTDIRNGHTDYLDAPPSRTTAPIYYPPNNLQSLAFTMKVLRNRLTGRAGRR